MYKFGYGQVQALEFMFEYRLYEAIVREPVVGDLRSLDRKRSPLGKREVALRIGIFNQSLSTI